MNHKIYVNKKLFQVLECSWDELLTKVKEAEDLDYIMKHCDTDQDGKISRAEYLPAFAAWEELAETKVQSAQCCSIL